MTELTDLQPVDVLESRSRLARSVGVAVAGGAAVGGGLIALESPSRADAVADLSTGVTSLSNIYDAATPIAVGVVIFGCAVMVVKRLLYA